MNFFYTVLMVSLMQLLKHVEAARETTSSAPLRSTTTTTTSTTTTQALGCMDKKACNFDSGAQIDDESCKFPSDKNHDCKGKCTAKVDNCGICGGKGMGKDKTKCSNNKFFGDDYCDDGNNNCACGWDGGDCCGNSPKKNKWCKKCECLDPQQKGVTSKPCSQPCGKKNFKGDGYCDDNNNFCGCAWDGGDCCGVGHTYTYCKKCLCLDPKFKAPAPDKNRCSKKCNKSCRKPKWAKDGICDDENNRCGCDWDGGDCCGTKNNYSHCTECKCLDCDFKFPTDGCVKQIKGFCLQPNRKGDGHCDDINNIAGCAWDGGDCCGTSIYTECKKCECLDCNYKFKPPAKDACTKWIRSNCAKPKYKGDGWCDDKNNVAGCAWDGGDCCGKAGRPDKYNYCTKCKCLDCTFKGDGDKCVPTSKKSCAAINWKGDKTCDDGNNHAGCNWDGGDCCGKENDYNICKDCTCKDCQHKEAVVKDPCMKGKKLKGSCKEVDYVKDGHCDDGNNNAWCSWDGGDCCGWSGQPKQYSYCKECKCKDCTFVNIIDKCTGKKVKQGGGCRKANWLRDGFCDPENNNGGCNWDGGDCCLANPGSRKFCKSNDKLCVCRDCAHQHLSKCPNPVGKRKKCAQVAHKGDGICDNGNNNCVCGWDGGDCCGKDKNYSYCGTECRCFDPRQKCGGFCKRQKWVKDGLCDPGNNNCACQWDGGDCCGISNKGLEHQFGYCKLDCFCKNPAHKLYTSKRGAKCDAPCGKSPWLKDDGICDDQHNTCGCNWDGGDCCMEKKDKKKCTKCLCRNPLSPRYGTS